MKSQTKLHLWGGILLLLFSFFTYGLSLGQRSLWGSEGRWAVISREMVESGNYFKPTINGELYYDKPLLSYWMVVGSHFLTRTWDTATIRIPSLLLGVATVLVIYGMGLVLFDFWTALMAGLILATSHGMVFWSHTAQVETHTVFSVTLCLFFLYQSFYTSKKKYIFGFWITAWVSCLLKGLLSLALPLAVGGLFLTVEFFLICRKSSPLLKSMGGGLKRATFYFFRIYSVRAFLVGALLYFAPFVCSSDGLEGLRLVWKENIQRFFNPFDHKGHWYTYLVSIPVLFLPWTILLPFLPKIKGWFKKKESRFIVIWALGTIIFFQASGSKRSYYILPILPPLALMVAGLFQHWREKLGRLESVIVLILISALGGAGVVLIAFPSFLPFQKVLGFCALSGAMILYLLHHFFPIQKTFLCSLLGLAWGIQVLLWGLFIPWAEVYRPLAQFYKSPSIQTYLDPTGEIAFYKVSGPASHIFYLHPSHSIPHFGEEKQMRNYLLAPQRRYVILEKKNFWHLIRTSKFYRQVYSYSPPLPLSPIKPKPRKNLVLISNRPLVR